MVEKLWFKPAKRGDGIKPGVERSGTPGSLYAKAEPAKWATAVHQNESQRLGYRMLRALCLSLLVNLGVRFAPPQASCFHPLRGFGECYGALTSTVFGLRLVKEITN